LKSCPRASATPLPPPLLLLMAVSPTFGILGPALRAGSPRSTAPWSRRRGQPRAPPAPAPPARLRLLHGSAHSFAPRRGHGAGAAPLSAPRPYDWSRLGPLHRITFPPAARPPFTLAPPHQRHVPSPRSAVRRCASRKAIRLSRSQTRSGSVQRIAASVSAQGQALHGSPLHPRGRAALRRCGLVPRMVLQP